MKKDLKVKKTMIITSDERWHGFLRPRRRMPIAVVCHGVLGSTSTRGRGLGLAKAWKAEDFVKG
jgi:hypothetical protein